MRAEREYLEFFGAKPDVAARKHRFRPDELDHAFRWAYFAERSEFGGQWSTHVLVSRFMFPSGIHEHAIVFDSQFAKIKRHRGRIFPARNRRDYTFSVQATRQLRVIGPASVTHSSSSSCAPVALRTRFGRCFSYFRTCARWHSLHRRRPFFSW